MIENYAWRGGSEMLLRHGEGSPVTLLVLPALFEEANRTRRFVVSIMRALAAANIGTILPDLPGTGESLHDLADVTWHDWQDAVGRLAPGVAGSIAIRGGALLDKGVATRWRLAPETGNRLLRDLLRSTAWSEGATVETLHARAMQAPVTLAGTRFAPELYRSIAAASPEGTATMSKGLPTPIWRAAEPVDTDQYVAAIAQEIVDWTSICVVS